MANTKDYSMREMIIDKYLSTGKEFTRMEIQELINKHLAERGMIPVTSKATVIGDLHEMNAKFSQRYGKDGIVYEDRHCKRYYRYADGISSIYNSELTADEVEKLLEVRTLLKGLHGMPNSDWLEEMTVRFDQNMMGGNRTVVFFEDGAKKDAEFFQTVFDAIVNKRVLKLCYRKFKSEPSERLICPYFLKQYNQRWYMYVHDEKREGIICFALDRIQWLKVMEDEQFVEADVDLDNYLDHIVGVTLPKDGKVERIVLKVDDWVADYLKTAPIHQSQQIELADDGSYRLTLDLIVNHELEQELLVYGEHVTVMEPAAFRERMADRIKRLAEHYD